MAQQLFGKIFQQMYESSVCEDWKAMVVFQQLIVLADKDGVVDMTPEAIQRRTNIPMEIISHGLSSLEQEDKRSRSAIHDGRRIILLDEHRDWGWRIVNYAIYVLKASQAERNEIRKSQMREKRRAEKSQINQVCPKVSHSVPNVPHIDIDIDVDKDLKAVSKARPKNAMEVTEYAKTINFNLDGELFVDYYKAQGWKQKNGRPLKDWKAAVRTWARREKKTNPNNGNAEVWETIENAVRHNGRNYDAYANLGQRNMKAIEKVAGSWMALCAKTDRELSFVKKQFLLEIGR